MAATPSTMLALGTQAPDFKLPNAVDGKVVALDDLRDARRFVGRVEQYLREEGEM